MQIHTTLIPEVLVVEPTVIYDDRGYFYESFNALRFQKITGIDATFVQDNHSKSRRNVIRGLHYQIGRAQGKLVRVIAGEVFDVAVDIRENSRTFGRWTGAILSSENRRQRWIPKGFAHGFLVTSESAELLYKTTDYWVKEYDRTILWNDPVINVDWPISGKPVLSARDMAGRTLDQIETFS